MQPEQRRPAPGDLQPLSHDIELELSTSAEADSAVGILEVALCAQWHTETRRGKSAVLSKMAPGELVLDLNEQDATALSVQEGDVVNVVSRRAGLTARARLTPCVKPGEAYLPMHDSRVNQLTHASFDPHSRQRSYKHSAVRVEKA
jgi:anaerobic selenocysteine-containing dehydrogenase